MRNPCTATKSSPCLQQPEKARAQQRRPRLSLSSTSCCSECGPWSSSSSTPWELVAAKSLQPCPTLCDPIDGSPPGSPIPGILQAITLEWVAISFSSAWNWKVKVKSLSLIRLVATPWTAACRAPPSMGFSRQEYWSGLPLPSLRKLLLSAKGSEFNVYLIHSFLQVSANRKIR